jgi:hypothetical protein
VIQGRVLLPQLEIKFPVFFTDVVWTPLVSERTSPLDRSKSYRSPLVCLRQMIEHVIVAGAVGESRSYPFELCPVPSNSEQEQWNETHFSFRQRRSTLRNALSSEKWWGYRIKFQAPFCVAVFIPSPSFIGPPPEYEVSHIVSGNFIV